MEKRPLVSDCPTSPQTPHSTVLTSEEEEMIVVFLRQALPPLDDFLYALQATILHLTRLLLHRYLQIYGISRLPDVEGDKLPKEKFRSHPIYYFHIDIAELQKSKVTLSFFGY